MSWLNRVHVRNQVLERQARKPELNSLSVAALAAFFLSIGASGAGAAEPSLLDRYFTIQGKPRIQVVQEQALPPELYSFALRPDGADLGGLGGDLSAANLVLDQIINIGKKVWDVIAANKPVANFQTDTANALPKGATGWETLAGWQVPASRLYRFTYQNGFGMDVVDFKFRVLYSFGGNVGGKGHYLANVTVVPADLSVDWGYTFNAQASVPAVLDAGTAADPVGAAQLLVSWKIDTVIKHEQSSESFDVRGDGTFTDLSNGN